MTGTEKRWTSGLPGRSTGCAITIRRARRHDRPRADAGAPYGVSRRRIEQDRRPGPPFDEFELDWTRNSSVFATAVTCNACAAAPARSGKAAPPAAAANDSPAPTGDRRRYRWRPGPAGASRGQRRWPRHARERGARTGRISQAADPSERRRQAYWPRRTRDDLHPSSRTRWRARSGVMIDSTFI
jgi:hypothetical protein